MSLALVLAVAIAGPAASQEHGMGEHGYEGGGSGAVAPGMSSSVRIGFDTVRPSRLDIVTGESVTWTNDSARVHTVTADDDSFDSGRLSSSRTYTHRFTAAGEAPYHCTLHPLIQGVVDVHELLLDTPEQAGAPRRPFPLSGRAALPAGTVVSIEADGGTGFAPVTSAQVGDDGRFAARVVPAATASYRAVAGDVASPPVRLLVLDRRVALTVRRIGGHLQLRAKVTPASRGGRVVLQLFLPERFGWWPVQGARLGADSDARFTLHSMRRLRARVRYTLADGATALATSRTVHVGPPAGHHADQRSPSAFVVGASASLPPPRTRRVARGSTTRAAAPSQYGFGT
jgi:plastocyanin